MTATQESIRNLLLVAALIPLVSSLLVIFFGRYLKTLAGWFATLMLGIAFGCSLVAMLQWVGEKQLSNIVWNVPWIPLPGMKGQYLYLGILVDGLTIAMMTMVTGIATLVHLYSVGYMKGDKRFSRFFAYLSLFTFSMLGIVLSNSIMQLFVFWELVGLTSYLLIGFWFEKRGPQLACKKAFVMNRIGDMGFLVGFGILFYQLGGRLLLPAAEGVVGVDGKPLMSLLGALTLPTDQGGLGIDVLHPPMWLTIAGIGLFFGAMGKSAQFPLHTWLPDAMEGPTPVSSIVHSATMVAAGVYLTARIYPILTPGAHLFIATIGLITAVIAACMALVMTDIKRVLAYSTLSQLGYMILGLGSGAWSFALFHLITHAFFKCCLFQCAGSVIHAAHHQQDMRYYGGLMRKMPLTALCYFICTLAIAGASIPLIPPINGYAIAMSGFFSKDGIIAGTFAYSEALKGATFVGYSSLFYWGPVVVAYLTVFYMTRSFALTFLGKPRDQHLHDHAHEAPVPMLIPQICLAVMAFLTAPMILPFFDLISSATPKVAYLQPAINEASGVVPKFPDIENKLMHEGFHHVHGALLHGLSWVIMMALGLVIYTPGLKIAEKIVAIPGVKQIHNWWLNKFYFDGLYDIFAVGLGKLIAGICSFVDKCIVDGLVNLSGSVTKLSAWATGLFDTKVVDGTVNGAAVFAQNAGDILRTTQPGRVRAYVLLMFATGAIVTLAVITVVIVSR